LLQLHQVQEELEKFFLTDQAKQRQLEEMTQKRLFADEKLEILRKELAEAKENRDEQEEEKEEALEEAELTLLQLHQVQEELESYFLRSKSSDELAEAQREQLSRAKSLLCSLIKHPGGELNSFKAVDVEVLPPESSQYGNNGPVQTEALLNTYRASLQKATDLLKQKFGN